ncbi:hypothetical protein, partial [Methylorubrum podarium]|uniref:hypothetical protein n=1 Tax=Methylorubrum podarium TaxID=200476 RepID=UPI001EE27AAB
DRRRPARRLGGVPAFVGRKVILFLRGRCHDGSSHEGGGGSSASPGLAVQSRTDRISQSRSPLA